MDLNDHKKDLETWGVTRFDGLIAKADAILARDLIHKVGQDHGLYTSDGWRRSQSRFSAAGRFRTAINVLSHSVDFPNLISRQLVDTAHILIEEAVTPSPPGQQILFTLPGATSWCVPHDVWHVDASRLGPLGPPGLQMFTFLDDVEPEGGGTLIVAGSHRLLNHSGVLRSKEIKQRLSREPYFRSLFDPKRAPINRLEDAAGSVDDVDLKIVEITGQVGDVYFMDLRVLHTPAVNASDKARLMLTCRLPRTAVASVYMTSNAGADSPS